MNISQQTLSQSNHPYRIALLFRQSKFLQIAALKKFVEKFSRIRVAYVCYNAMSQILVELFREQFQVCEIREIKDP